MESLEKDYLVQFPHFETGSFLLTVESCGFLRLSQTVTKPSKLGFWFCSCLGDFVFFFFFFNLSLGLCVIVSFEFTLCSRLVSNLQQSFVLGLLSARIIGMSYHASPG